MIIGLLDANGNWVPIDTNTLFQQLVGQETVIMGISLGDIAEIRACMMKEGFDPTRHQDVLDFLSRRKER